MTPASRRALGQYRRRLREAEADPVKRITAYYLESRKRIQREVQALLATIATSGVTTGADAIQLAQHQALMAAIDDELRGLGATVTRSLTRAQREAIDAAIASGRAFAEGQGQSIDQTLRVARQWAAVPPAVIDGYVGSLRDGTPFRALLERLGPAIGKSIEQEIADGLVRSASTEDMAKRIMQRTEMGYRRALTIAHEAVYDSSRWAMQQFMAENADILRGSQRLEVLDGRTCAACWLLHGKEYPLGAEMERHINCRGMLMPLLIDGGNLEIEPGEAQLRRQPEAVQLNAFGGNKTAHQAWASGEIPLRNFVKVHDDQGYGPQTSMLGASGAQKNGGGGGGGSRIPPSHSGGNDEQRPVAEVARDMRDLPLDGVVEIGAIPAAALETWADRVTDTTVVTGPQYRHIVDDYPDRAAIDRLEERIIETVRNPELVLQAPENPTVANLVSGIDSRYDLHVSVRISSDPQLKNSVLSTRKQRRTRRTSPAGRRQTVWKRDEVGKR